MPATKKSPTRVVDTIWTTKYALTTGITVLGPATIEGSMATFRQPDGMLQFFHGRDFHLSLEAALERAEQMRRGYLGKLQADIERLRAKAITVYSPYPRNKEPTP